MLRYTISGDGGGGSIVKTGTEMAADIAAQNADGPLRQELARAAASESALGALLDAHKVDVGVRVLSASSLDVKNGGFLVNGGFEFGVAPNTTAEFTVFFVHSMNQ